MPTDEAKENTDREIWQRDPGDFYSPSIHVTAEGAIGMNVGGTVIVMDVEDWFLLAAKRSDRKFETTDEEVEAGARALHEHESDVLAAHGQRRRAAWEKQSLSLQNAERNRARAALTAAERVRSLNAAASDAQSHGRGYMMGDKHIPIEDVEMTSEEIARSLNAEQREGGA